MSSDNIFVMDIGEVMEFTEEGAKPGKKVQSGMTMVDGLGIGDVGNIVLRDRKMLAEEGLIVVVAGISRETRQLVSGPEVISRGFVYVRESEELMNKTRDIVRASLDKCQKKNIMEWSGYKNVIKDDLNNFFYQTMKRSPVILPIIMEV